MPGFDGGFGRTLGGMSRIHSGGLYPSYLGGICMAWVGVKEWTCDGWQ